MSEFREEQAACLAGEQNERDANESPRLAWLRRLAGVPLVVLSVYLVVAHIAGG
jgi:hypothetical protein